MTPLTPLAQSSAAKAASGARSRTRRRAFAGPAGERLPCSQLRTVSMGTPMRAANAACVNPVLRRTRRAYAAASWRKLSSSFAACSAISLSLVRSTRAESMRPCSGRRSPVSARNADPSGYRVTRTRFIASYLSLIGLARRDEANAPLTRRVQNDEHPSIDLSHSANVGLRTTFANPKRVTFWKAEDAR